MNESKALLKEARKAIDANEFDSAVKKCNRVLESDGDNYMALVLLGVALRDDDSAERAFRKAIALKDNSALAYQGLVKFYQLKGTADCLVSSIRVYYKMTSFPGVNEPEVFDNIYDVAVKLNDAKVAGDVINDIINQEKDHDKKSTLIKLLYRVLTGTDVYYHETSNELLLLFEIVINQAKVNFEDVFLLKYLKCFYDVKGYSSAIEKFSELNNKSFILNEWFCKIFIENFIFETDTNPVVDDVESLVPQLTMENPNSEILQMAVAVINFVKKKKMDAYILAYNIANAEKEKEYVIIIRALCCLELGRYVEAENLTVALVDHKDSKLARRAQKITLIAKSLQRTDETCLESIDIGKKLNLNQLGEMEYVALFRSYVHLNEYSEAEKCLKKLINTSVYTSLKITLLQHIGNTEEAIDTLFENKNDPFCQIQLGIFYLEKKEYTNAFNTFLQSARNDPHNFLIFAYLGDYYTLYGNNLEKAKKCYLKAFELNPEYIKAGKNLSSTYMRLKDWPSNEIFLKSLTKSGLQMNNKLSHWPWMHLGLHYIALEQWDTAIVNLRTYIRLNSLDADAWEALADTYHHRGSYTSAIKCYRKAIEVDSSRKYCHVQIGTIQCLLGHLRDALNTYETLCDDSFLPGLKGMAEVKICIADQMHCQNLYGSCREKAQEAIDLISPLVSHNKLICLWKIISNGIFIILRLPLKYNWLNFNKRFLSNGEKDDIQKYEGEEIFNLAILCICKMIGLSDGSDSYLYHDLAAVYLTFYDVSKITQYAEKSFTAIEKCIEIEKKRWQHWNLLGIICASKAMNKYNLAQHALIKALELDPINATVWSNLGVLYFIVGNTKLANQAFQKAQESNPTFLQSWIGQALIAESIGHYDAMDLFRHASQLGFHKESSLGYSYWVSSSLVERNDDNSFNLNYSIKNMHAIPAACDLMSWYNEFDNKNACSWNIYGIILEQMEHFNKALGAFTIALDHVDAENRSGVILNLARIYSRVKKYNSGIEMIKLIPEINFNIACVLAELHYKNNQYEEAYSTYNTILQYLADDTNDKNYVLMSLANIAFKLDDEVALDALRIQIMNTDENNQMKLKTTNSLQSFCALSLLNHDSKTSKTLLQTLGVRKKTYFVHFLEACHLLLTSNNTTNAMRSLLKQIHSNPEFDDLWKIVAKISGSDVSLTNTSIKKYLTSKNLVDNIEYLKIICLSELLLENINASKIYAQKIVRIRPDNGENWILLISSLSKLSNLTRPSADKFNLKKLTHCIINEFTLKKHLKFWLTETFLL